MFPYVEIYPSTVTEFLDMLKTVDEKIIGFETMTIDTDGTAWSDVSIIYGDAVDVSVIPTSLDGYTLA